MTGSTKPTPDGFLNVFKPYGWTSHDVVGLVRRLTRTRRVGHGGTLDPCATGVLAVAVGRATRLVDYLAGQDKTYLADVVLGISTTTDDAEGPVVREVDPSFIRLVDLTIALSGFVGVIEQVPPQYSAVKVQGKKSYEIARRGGEARLNARLVTVRGIAIVGWQPPTLGLMVRCSKGTYIRSLARDLGNELGVGAHLGALVRLASGSFDVADAVRVENLRIASEAGHMADLLHPPDIAVKHLPALVLSAGIVDHMLLGRPWEGASGLPEATTARVYSQTGDFLGLAQLLDGCWQPKVVFTKAEDVGEKG